MSRYARPFLAKSQSLVCWSRSGLQIRTIYQSGPAFAAWAGEVIAIEPNPDFCAIHRGLGNEIYEYACSDTESDDAEFYVVDSQGADYLGGKVSFESFSSLGIKDEFAALHETVRSKTKVKKISVKVRKLDTILREHAPEVSLIDILAVDVEGWELSVMRGLSIETFMPQIVILENLFKSDAYVLYMESKGYKLWQRLEPNDIFASAAALSQYNVRSEKPTKRSYLTKLFSIPPVH